MMRLGGVLLAMVVLRSAASQAIDVPRTGHSAVLLSDGRVLLIGGLTSDGGLTGVTEVVDPQTNAQPPGPLGLVGSLVEPRWNALAMNVPGRGVLLLGGQTASGATGLIERFDEVTGQWAFDSLTADGRVNACWATRPNGEVWVAGGSTGAGTANAVQLRPWLLTSGTTLNLGVEACGAVGLDSDVMLFAGGRLPIGLVSTAANLVVGGQFQFTPTAPLPRGRWGHTLTALRDGGVLLIGGWESPGVPATHRLQFDPPSGTWRDAGAAPPFVEHLSFLMPNDVIVVIESPDGGNMTRLSLVHPSGSISLGGTSQPAGNGATWLLLPNGHLFASGGHSDAGVLNWSTSQSLELPAVRLAGSPLAQPRGGLVATLLPDGRVLAAGGANLAPLTSVEVLHRTSGVWLDGGSLLAAREDATATVLLSGEVLIAGGRGATGTLKSVERYEPTTGTSRLVSPMRLARTGHLASLLPDGRVLVSGGVGLASTELYDPQTDRWSDGPVMPFSGPGHAAILMGDSRVFLQRNLLSIAWDPADGGVSTLPDTGRELTFARAGLSANGSLFLVGGLDATGAPRREVHVFNVRRYGGGWTTATSYVEARSPLFIGFDNEQIAALGGRTDAGVPAQMMLALDLQSFFINSLTTVEGHAEGALVWLPEGDALIIGGRTGPTSAATGGTEWIEPGMFAPLSNRPRVQPVGDLAPGQLVRVRGSGFVVATGGGSRTMDDRVPVVALRRMDNGAIRVVASTLVSPTELEFTVPADLPFGHAWLSVTVRAVPSVAVAVRVAAAVGAACVEGSFCASWLCTAGRCVMPVDAGVPDGGTSDGGTSDGGTNDGGTSDGGTSDGGTNDGGTSDGGTNDGGTNDDGAADGGPPVGGPLGPPKVATVGCACSMTPALEPWGLLLGWVFAGRRRASRVLKSARCSRVLSPSPLRGRGRQTPGLFQQPARLRGMERDGWRAAGEAHLARAQLRRALGAFRRALEQDLRGEQSFTLHQLISVTTQVLSQRGAYFLHPSEETARSLWLERGSPALPEPDFQALTDRARELEQETLVTLFTGRRLSPGLADQALTAGVPDEDFRAQARAAVLWLYEALLQREEPITSG